MVAASSGVMVGPQVSLQANQGAAPQLPRTVGRDPQPAPDHLEGQSVVVMPTNHLTVMLGEPAQGLLDRVVALLVLKLPAGGREGVVQDTIQPS